MSNTYRFIGDCHVTHYIYRSLVYLSITLRYSGLFGLVCNSPVQGQVVTGIISIPRHSEAVWQRGEVFRNRRLENSDYFFRQRQNQGILVLKHSHRQLTFIKPFRKIDRIDLAMACT
ncbi:hypothetical protein ACN42_g3727 [Penicillium freii]|uniref:Uncharacterized protein n=1 Tax=Penicillium freii TaxID=48697 RepID=A0A101MMV7_PENFR|nr:hypothetical protein ACN42_g3727 [Penicillium freii]